jgi:hypothetical protein
VSARDIIGSLLLVAAGGLGGALTGGVAGGVILSIVGIGLAALIVVAQVRWLVALPVIAGVTVGAVVGWSIPHRRCAPDGCVVIEVLAGFVTALGALVGVGLVVALAVRSFDEHRQAAAAPPPDEPPAP